MRNHIRKEDINGDPSLRATHVFGRAPVTKGGLVDDTVQCFRCGGKGHVACVCLSLRTVVALTATKYYSSSPVLHS